MDHFGLSETYDPKMTESESDERAASWNSVLSMIEEIIVESEELKLTIQSDYCECPECGEPLNKFVITKMNTASEDQALVIKGKCPECEEKFQYYGYIA